MAAESVTISVDTESEIGRAVAQIRGNVPVVCLEIKGERYRLTPEHPFAQYDPERMLAALRASAGSLAGVDIEALKREIRAQR